MPCVLQVHLVNLKYVFLSRPLFIFQQIKDLLFLTYLDIDVYMTLRLKKKISSPDRLLFVAMIYLSLTFLISVIESQLDVDLTFLCTLVMLAVER